MVSRRRAVFRFLTAVATSSKPRELPACLVSFWASITAESGGLNPSVATYGIAAAQHSPDYQTASCICFQISPFTRPIRYKHTGLSASA